MTQGDIARCVKDEDDRYAGEADAQWRRGTDGQCPDDITG